MSHELHVIFKGKVQGVGFRWTVVDHAEKLGLTGTAKNLANGTVEVYAQGPKESLEKFLEAVKNDAGSARIDSIKTRYLTPQTTYPNFHILH
jgi:acylphosphatase